MTEQEREAAFRLALASWAEARAKQQQEKIDRLEAERARTMALCSQQVLRLEAEIKRLEATLDALVDALNAKAVEWTGAFDAGVERAEAKAQEKIDRLERVAEAALRLAESGELGHWNHKTIVRVDGDLALILGAALALLDADDEPFQVTLRAYPAIFEGER